MLESPFRLTILESTEKNEGKIVLEPLRQGFGHTIGVALRRVMLSVLKGAAVTKVKIKGVNHQFTSLKGMKEDIVELLLNIKQIKLTYVGEKPETLHFQATGPGKITAADLKGPATVKIINPDIELATLADKKSKLSLELTVESGSGYLTAAEQGKQKLGVIPIDASFSPVVRVFYSIKATRIGRRTDYDKLILTVKTDGSLTPRKAVVEAAKILVSHFQQIVSPVKTLSDDSSVSPEGNDSAVMKLTLEELGLPTRVVNALLKADYKTVTDIVVAKREDIAKIKNIGAKSVAGIYSKIREKGVQIPG